MRLAVRQLRYPDVQKAVGVHHHPELSHELVRCDMVTARRKSSQYIRRSADTQQLHGPTVAHLFIGCQRVSVNGELLRTSPHLASAIRAVSLGFVLPSIPVRSGDLGVSSRAVPKHAPGGDPGAHAKVPWGPWTPRQRPTRTFVSGPAVRYRVVVPTWRVGGACLRNGYDVECR